MCSFLDDINVWPLKKEAKMKLSKYLKSFEIMLNLFWAFWAVSSPYCLIFSTIKCQASLISSFDSEINIHSGGNVTQWHIVPISVMGFSQQKTNVM